MLLNYYYLLVKLYEFPTNIYRYFEKVGSINKKKQLFVAFFCSSAYGNRTRMPRLRILYPNR